MKSHLVAPVLLASLFSALPAIGQISPANMRSGSDSIGVNCAGPGISTKSFFTVPTGQQFVLTDFSGTAFTTYDILDNQATVRWNVPEQEIDTPGETHARMSWQTGLAFNAGHTVDVRVSCTGVAYAHFSWSGYLVPTAGATVPGNSQGGQLGFELGPNPSRQVVTLKFELSQPANVRLAIYDASGRQVRALANAPFALGTYTETWDGRTQTGAVAPPGVYFARLESNKGRSVRRLVRVR